MNGVAAVATAGSASAAETISDSKSAGMRNDPVLIAPNISAGGP